ncbi:Cullin binding-domain-containing protein [Lipomyces arxii]|uniref:Cullin binding-domain-containing protein n=1 Tax=Lipomyces arxii TaxID=56418 RepID=UPI0034CE8C35
MSSYTSTQRTAIAQFTSATSTSTRVATSYLRSNGWSIERAVAAYYDAGSGSLTPQKRDSKALTELFDKYKDLEDPTSIGLDGTINYIQDLGVDLEDPVVLALAYKLSAPTVGQFSKQGFINGWQEMGADTITKMKKVVETLRDQMQNDPVFFKNVYRFTFIFVRSPGQRILNLDSAVEYWTLLLEDRFPDKRSFDQWVSFVTEQYKKAIPRDTWNMLLDFVVNVLNNANGLDSYDSEAAWPSIFDEFVAYLKR